MVGPLAITRRQPPLRPYALLYLYRRRLRVHFVQELLAGLGVAIAVALVFATMVAAGSVTGSAGELAHAVAGPATLQLHSRTPAGLPERLLARVEHLPGVARAAPLLEQTATLSMPAHAASRAVTVDLAGTDTSLAVLDGLAHTLPRAALAASGIGLSRETALALGDLGDPRAGAQPSVQLKLGASSRELPVSAVLGPEAFGALAQARVAVMPLEELQRLAGLPGRISRILVEPQPGYGGRVRAELSALTAEKIDVAPAEQDVALLRAALRPSNQASTLFATISGLLGVLLAVTALLLTVPERRRAIADLRMIGVKRGAIAQMLLSQALTLGTFASLLGLAGGYLLSRYTLHQSNSYLAEAFTLGSNTLVTARPALVALGGGVLAACLASAVPLADLRRERMLDAIYREHRAAETALSPKALVAVALLLATLLAIATLLFALVPAQALLTCTLLALSAVLAVPLALAGVLRAAHTLAERLQRLTILPVALSALRSTALRSLTLAATGAVALFGAVALGNARGDLLHGIQRLAHAYAADASIWVGTPGDNQATVAFQPGDLGARIARIPGVARVQRFQGGFSQFGDRRVWLLARPPGAERHLLESQLLEGDAARAMARLARGGWIVASQQLALEHGARPGGTLTLPTPSGAARMRVAATTTNLAWAPGVVVIGAADYRRLWRTAMTTALDVTPRSGADLAHVMAGIERALGPNSGLQVLDANARERQIDALTSEGLGQLGEITTLLLIAAILAMAAALTSAIWQRRQSLASLRLSGVRPRRLRLILLFESALMLGSGCLTGAMAGVYGQLAIDGYLRQVTGFPVTSMAQGARPLEILALVAAIVLAIVAVPGYAASRVSPMLAFNE